MEIKDADNLIFICEKNEQITLKIECEATVFSVNHDFNPILGNDLFSQSENEGTLVFKVTQETTLRMSFNFSGSAGAKYVCEFSPVENDPDKVFHHRIRQAFGARRRRREFAFQIES